MLRTNGLAAVGEIPPELARALCGYKRPGLQRGFRSRRVILGGWSGQRQSTDGLTVRAGAARHA